MADTKFPYVIVGGGLAGASAAKGIRQLDPNGPILLLTAETELPYHRPPLTKGLWTGKKQESQISVEDKTFYEKNGVALRLGCPAVSIDAKNKQVTDLSGTTYTFEKLLLASGGAPRRLSIPGGDSPDICYYRYLSDYHRVRSGIKDESTVLVIGGGFIGSEIAAALSMNKAAVAMVFPDSHICSRVFSPALANAVEQKFLANGVRLLGSRNVSSIRQANGQFYAKMTDGSEVTATMVIAGIGIVPDTRLAQSAGIDVGNGICVNELLQTSAPWIFAAGDNAEFHYPALGWRMRVEHWDNALNQGETAGRNMAGNKEPYTYMPYFFSDLYDFGYEAVGDTDARLETVADWQKENDTGVVHYLRDKKVVGAMMCNVWGQVPQARELILHKEQMAEIR